MKIRIGSVIAVFAVVACDEESVREELEDEIAAHDQDLGDAEEQGAERVEGAEPDGSADSAQPGEPPSTGELPVVVPAATLGGSTQSKGGLTCHNSWSGRTGSTKCSGNNGVKWRLRVRCSFQGDYTGPWNYGTGSDAFDCNFHAQSASVVWG